MVVLHFYRALSCDSAIPYIPKIYRIWLLVEASPIAIFCCLLDKCRIPRELLGCLLECGGDLALCIDVW